MSNLEYRLKMSNELTDLEIGDFIEIFNKVFKAQHDRLWFDWKYLDNIYGPSYMVIVYDGKRPVAVRSFWRNDIEALESYQPCDTAVDSDYRGRGIFSKMTKLVRDRLDSNLIYNYPNENSYPGYIKMGWEVKEYYYLKLVFSKKNLSRESEYIEDHYFRWKFLKSPISDYYYCKEAKDYYLLYKRSDKIYYVLGRFNGQIDHNLKKVERPILFNYTNQKTLMYRLIKNRARIVSYDIDKKFKDIKIPIYKGDFF